jgi:anthranilate phosphoribosyltransferase
MKYALGPRREIGIRTIFNMLGPLTNPAGATSQLIGVFDSKLTEVFAGVLRNLGTKRAFVVHGSDGLDEATVTGPTRVSELRNGKIHTYNLDPGEFFEGVHSLAELAGADAQTNAEIMKDILLGGEGAKRKVVLLNSALAIVAGEKAGTVREGIELAAECIDSRAALKKLQALIEMSRS